MTTRRCALAAALLFTSGSALLAAQLPPVVQLTLNENPYGPSPLAVAAVQENLDHLYRYTGDEAAALTAQIAELEGVAPEQIVLGEILELLGQHLSLQGGPGGEFIYSVPGYPALVNAAKPVGGIVISVPLNARLENDLPALAAKVNARTRAVFLVNPHNPSGTVNDAKVFRDFLRTVSSQALVIVDEAYLEFSDDFAGRTAVAATKAGENVLVFRTFAKAHGLAGLPLGYAVAPRAVADYLHQQGLGGPRDLNRLAVAAASGSLRDERYIAQVHDAIAAERMKWNAVLDELKLPRTNSQANFVYFDARRPHAEVVAALQAAGVFVGRSFPPYDNWVRISIGLPSENDRALAALRAAVAKR